MPTAWTQVGFRARNDDGGEVSGAWKAAVNTNIKIKAGVTFRLRFDCSETGTTAATLAGQLQCNKNGGAFQAVTASSTIAKAVASQNGVNGAATTQIISSGSFVAGNIDAADGLCAATGSIAQNSHTELEFCVQLDTITTTAEDAIQFRVVVSPSTAFGTYTQTPTITVIRANQFQNYMRFK
jgi:hypothetical protein